MAAESLAVLALKGVETGLINLASKYAEKRFASSTPRSSKTKENLRPHIEETFRKCSCIKTLLNPQTPTDFLSIYATQRFHSRGKVIDQYDMVSVSRENSGGLIITGTGGSGKSIFTRYLWLSLFLQSDGRIPLFVELRDMNALSSLSIIPYLHHAVIGGQSNLSEHQFKTHLRKGDFIIILDGFDEIQRDRQEEARKSVSDLLTNYPETRIIVTSRPDDRFGAWQAFEVAAMAPLQKSDVLELVERAEFDIIPKKQFRKKLNEGLFDKHKSFLVNPLLASMMLLTYSHNFDIPDKMHLFYDQAFEALYNRHDSHKPGGYTRQFATKTSEDEFKRALSFFCLLTYYEERFVFTRDDLLRDLSKASKIEGLGFKASDLLSDLIHNVCILVPEGLSFVFSHRSFQEYFAAYCLAFVTTNMFYDIVSKLTERPNDEALKMLASMNPVAFRKLFVLPRAEALEEKLQLSSKQKDFARGMQDFDQKFSIYYLPQQSDDDKEPMVSIEGGNDVSMFAQLIIKVEVDRGVELFDLKKREADQAALGALYARFGLEAGDSLEISGDNGVIVFSSPGSPRFLRTSSGSGKKPVSFIKRVDPLADDLFKASFMYEFVCKRLQIVDEYIAANKRLERSSSAAMDGIFG